jgi:hypothetical protein
MKTRRMFMLGAAAGAAIAHLWDPESGQMRRATWSSRVETMKYRTMSWLEKYDQRAIRDLLRAWMTRPQPTERDDLDEYLSAGETAVLLERGGPTPTEAGDE